MGYENFERANGNDREIWPHVEKIALGVVVAKFGEVVAERCHDLSAREDSVDECDKKNENVCELAIVVAHGV